MSPRAACRLETLGFDPGLVYDYVEGNAGWLAYGLPREGDTATVRYAGELVDVDPPTCALNSPTSWSGLPGLVEHAQELAISMPALAGVSLVVSTEGQRAENVAARIRAALPALVGPSDGGTLRT